MSAGSMKQSKQERERKHSSEATTDNERTFLQKNRKKTGKILTKSRL